MADAPEISIVVPVFNGARTVERLVEELQSIEVPGGMEIILVNDGSSDDSHAVCSRIVDDAAIPVTLVDHTRNFGEHNAVLSGFRVARGRFVVTMDDDLQNPPSAVSALYEHAIATGADVVYAQFESKQHETWRNFGSWFANLTANLVFDKPRDLYLGTFRCLRRWVVEQTARYEGPYPHVDGLVLSMTTAISSVVVEHLPRESGASNYTVRRLIRLWMHLLLNFSVLPLRIATFFGLAMSAIGMLGGAYVLINYAIFGADVAGWASLMLGAFVFSGVQLFLLGLVGEYVGRVFLTVNLRPQSVVRDVRRPAGKHRA